MRFGVVGSLGSPGQIPEMAVAAEEAGWDGFFTWDGISVGHMDTFDPWALLGAVRTSRIRLGAMVFALPRRHPWKVARGDLVGGVALGGRRGPAGADPRADPAGPAAGVAARGSVRFLPLSCATRGRHAALRAPRGLSAGTWWQISIANHAVERAFE